MSMQLKTLLNRKGAMFDTPEELSAFMKNFKYQDFVYLMSPLEVLLTKQGSCHDQVMLELQELYDMGLNPKAKFLLAENGKGHGGETHSFTFYEYEGRWYWFENAWEDRRGIHMFNSYRDMLNTVVHDFRERTVSDRVHVAEFNISEHSIGEDLNSLVEICMNSEQFYSNL